MSRGRKAVKRLKIGCSLFVILGGLFATGISLYAKKQLDWAATVVPHLPEKMSRVSGEPSVLVSRDGKVLETIATEYRMPIKLKDVPDKVIHATLAAEDKRYYEHQGIDTWAVGRAFVSTVTGKRTEGASTITMQLAKRIFTSTKKTIDRKVQDMALAVMIERSYTKDQILELYLNQAYYGAGAYGVSAAADVYFGKDLKSLTYSEAATLARCVRRPSDENPFKDQKSSLRNRNSVLAIMRDEGWVSETEYDHALNEPLKLAKQHKADSSARLAPYFCDYVKSYIHDQMPEVDLTKGGFRIETTIDSRLQDYAEEKVREMATEHRSLRITTSAFVLLDRNGRIMAMVGGPDYRKDQFNVVTQGRRQPGSSFKPIVYATAFEYGALSPGGSVSNEPFLIRGASGRRYVRGGGKGGSVSVRSAIAFSINTPAMWAGKEVGIANVVRLAHTAFGIESELPAVDSLALGAGEVSPLEMAVAYSLFQSGGDRVKPMCVSKVIGPDGLTYRLNNPEFERRQISSSTAEGIDSCLRAVVTSGTGRAAGNATNARGKTGTTSDNKDAWFCGYTDKFIGVGWVANKQIDDSGRVRYRPMNDYVMGGHMVAPMWAKIVGKAQDLFGEEHRSMRSNRVSDERSSRNETEPVEEPDQGAAAQPGAEDMTGTTGNEGPVEDNRDAASGGANETPTAGGTEKKPEKEKSIDGEGGGEKVVFVEVCADSGMRASIYCPERIRRAYRAGGEPRGRCRTHTGGERQ